MKLGVLVVAACLAIVPAHAKNLRWASQGEITTLDPHSNFYDAKEFEEQRADWRSEYYGIGATIGDRKMAGNTDTYILATFEATPAYRAGLRFGDKITEIDGKPVKGKASGEVRDMLRGPRGTTVRVSVERAANGQKETGTLVWNGKVPGDQPAKPLSPGRYVLKVAAQDRAGNRSTGVPFAIGQVRYIALARKRVVVRPGGRFALRVSTDAPQVDWLLHGRHGTLPRGTLHLRAPRSAGVFRLNVSVGSHTAVCSVVVA